MGTYCIMYVLAVVGPTVLMNYIALGTMFIIEYTVIKYTQFVRSGIKYQI
jgi:hypothetical protein